jgi:hypothetical protein
MKTSKIGVLLCTSLQCGCVKSQEDREELIKEGYLNEDGSLTKKSNTLLGSIELLSTTFENSNEFVDKVSNAFNQKVDSVKKTTSDTFSVFSEIFDEAAKKLRK